MPIFLPMARPGVIWLNPGEVEQLPQQKRPFPGMYRSWDPCNVMHLGLFSFSQEAGVEILQDLIKLMGWFLLCTKQRIFLEGAEGLKVLF